MRDERYTRGPAPYEADGQGYAANGYDSDYVGQVAGFNRHQSANTRRVAKENPVTGAAKRLGGAVSGAVSGLVQGRRQASAAAASGRPSRAAASMSDGGDYLGVGNACRVCGNPVDPEQARCPHCGAFVKPLYTNPAFIIPVVILVVLVVLLTLAINSCKPVESGKTPGNTDDTPGSTQVDGNSRTSALAAAINSAQGMLDTQSANRTCTRYSLNNLQTVVTNAKAVLANEAATDEEIAQAAQSVSDAMAAMVTTQGVNYAWPWYFEDLIPNLAGYVGTQIAMNGTTQVVTVNADGTITASMAVSGDTSCMVYVTYYASDVYDANGAATELYVGRDFSAFGVVTGDVNGIPTMLADYVEAY